MWSLSQWLNELAMHKNLPTDFDARTGVRSLFPPGFRPAAISMLKQYVFKQDNSLESPGPNSGSPPAILGTTAVRADGSGNWLFAEKLSAGSSSPSKWACGFVFLFSDNKSVAHGTIDTWYFNDPTYSVSCGKDLWIAEHWPELFAQGCGLYLSEAEGLDNLPDFNNMATDFGFSWWSQLYISGAASTGAVLTPTSPTFELGDSNSGPDADDWVEWGNYETGLVN
jgi:hypothetical protein